MSTRGRARPFHPSKVKGTSGSGPGEEAVVKGVGEVEIQDPVEGCDFGPTDESIGLYFKVEKITSWGVDGP